MNRFFDKVFPEPNTGCWIWCGATHPSGHGSVNAKSHNGLNWAHRYSYFVENGDFDRDQLVLHKCDNPWCVNPLHLYLGSKGDNVRDLIERGSPKWASGNQIGTSKLTPFIVKEIKELLGVISNRQIAKKYNVSHSCINSIFNGNRWKEVL